MPAPSPPALGGIRNISLALSRDERCRPATAPRRSDPAARGGEIGGESPARGLSGETKPPPAGPRAVGAFSFHLQAAPWYFYRPPLLPSAGNPHSSVQHGAGLPRFVPAGVSASRGAPAKARRQAAGGSVTPRPLRSSRTQLRHELLRKPPGFTGASSRGSRLFTRSGSRASALHRGPLQYSQRPGKDAEAVAILKGTGRMQFLHLASPKARMG